MLKDTQQSLAAQAAIRALLSGKPPDQADVDYGDWDEVVTGLVDAYEDGGINAVKITWKALTKDNRSLIQLRSGDIENNSHREEPHHTDMGNAMLFAAEHGEDLRYCHVWRSWLVWDGTRWARDRAASVYEKAKKTVRSMYQSAVTSEWSEKRKALVKHALRSESNSRLKAMIELAQSEHGLPIQPEDLDLYKMKLNCRNGTLDLQTGVLHAHKPEDLITKRVPIDYEAGSQCPKFLAFLNRIMGDDEKLVTYLQRVLGYTLTGETTEQCLFMLYGSGANGKSVLIETIMGILGGDFAISTRTDTILSQSRSTIPNDIARMKGTRMVAVNEVDQGRRMAESLVKQMTGGDTVSARFMRGEYFDFIPEFKLFIRANHKPVIRGQDHAMWRRIKLIPFEVTIPEAEQNPDLTFELKEEYAGILAWMVEGCREWLSNGLGSPAAVTEATKDYQDEMDILGHFFEDETEEGGEVQASLLYERYKMWCETGGEKTMTATAFGIEMNNLKKYEKGRQKSGQVYFGISLKTIHQGSNSGKI